MMSSCHRSSQSWRIGGSMRCRISGALGVVIDGYLQARSDLRVQDGADLAQALDMGVRADQPAAGRRDPEMARAETLPGFQGAPPVVRGAGAGAHAGLDAERRRLAAGLAEPAVELRD